MLSYESPIFSVLREKVSRKTKVQPRVKPQALSSQRAHLIKKSKMQNFAASKNQPENRTLEQPLIF